jgi:hypothetical protein
MLKALQPTGADVELQETTFSIDVLGRYICNTWDEATGAGGYPFDAIVVGAGMFGAYCAEKLYRLGAGQGMRILVLDAGSFLVSEHVQNLARIGLNVPGAAATPTAGSDPGPRERVWGIPWRTTTPFPGLAYCLVGRSLYWGGWSPRLTAADLARWPRDVVRDLVGPPAAQRTYHIVEQETGVSEKTDYISGSLFVELRKRFNAAAAAGVATVDTIEDAPLAVQAKPPASGLFSFDKYSSAPVFVDAVREAAGAPCTTWRPCIRCRHPMASAGGTRSKLRPAAAPSP